ncbi:lipoprotein signal peptidase [Thiorhodovibrio frisius]|uniref:Lipoprotein signal peptidase n=2 Tax=Thiorhodovibrio frisius TaxID=631362 RepID=H8Z0W6_9GAMM|nr:lipoprotein signal peptidase [Thiorhodovibrio frisius]WPL23933.1 Lipoprotein signal peptidase [Thiorhodovibrio frisius]
MSDNMSAFTPSRAHWLWLSVTVIALDQLSKWLAERLLPLHEPVALMPMLNLTLMHNEGAAFSLLADAGGWQRWLFAGFALLVTIGLIIWLLRLDARERLTAAALTLLIGGAIGNLIDRVRTGRVVDFIDVYYGDWHWPAFNLADSAITLGVALLLIETLRAGKNT